MGPSWVATWWRREDHAEIVKKEIRILWGDYFRPEHVEQYPNLHNLVFTAMKQASAARQNVSMDAAQSLLASVQELAEIFWKTKGAEVRRAPPRVRRRAGRSSTRPSSSKLDKPAEKTAPRGAVFI